MVGLFFYFRQSIHMAPLWFLATLALAGGLGYLVAHFYSEPLNQRLRTRSIPLVPTGRAAAAD
jgi:peptidoglycan/LPS O-acetylase OafA/YrhL